MQKSLLMALPLFALVVATTGCGDVVLAHGTDASVHSDTLEMDVLLFDRPTAGDRTDAPLVDQSNGESSRADAIDSGQIEDAMGDVASMLDTTDVLTVRDVPSRPLADVTDASRDAPGDVVECQVGNAPEVCPIVLGLTQDRNARLTFRCCDGRCVSGTCPGFCNGEPCDAHAGMLCCTGRSQQFRCVPRDRGLCYPR